MAFIHIIKGQRHPRCQALVDLNNQSLLLNYFNLEDAVREKARLASVGLPHAGD